MGNRYPPSGTYCSQKSTPQILNIRFVNSDSVKTWVLSAVWFFLCKIQSIPQHSFMGMPTPFSIDRKKSKVGFVKAVNDGTTDERFAPA